MALDKFAGAKEAIMSYYAANGRESNCRAGSMTVISGAKVLSESADTEKIGFSRDDNHLFFDLGKRLLVSRMLTGQFPNYEAVLPRNNDRTFAVDREEITAAIRRVAILSDERSRTIKVAVAGGTLEITASHSDLGEAHETIEIDYNKEDLQVGFNYQYLLDFLTAADETQVNFEFKDSEVPLSYEAFRPRTTIIVTW
jgi:DNA polymerase-3 subunit beta